MKTLHDIINESLLDEDDLVRNAEKWEVVDRYVKRARSKSPKDDVDMLGNPVKVGDLVLAVNKGRPMPGVIVQIRYGCCAICFDPDMSKMKTTSQGDYKTTIGLYDVVKVTNDIVTQILK